MRLTLSTEDLSRYAERQLSSLFPDGQSLSVGRVVARALEVVEFRFAHIRLSSYSDDAGAKFNHLNSDQYASFLYECSRIAFREFSDQTLAEKFFCLNKAMNSIVCMYDTELPPIFLLIHTVGTVIGKARYGDCLVVCQGVTVGADRGNTPELGSGAILFGGASVLGKTTLGDNVTVAAGALVRGRDIPGDHIVAGHDPNLVIKRATRNLRDHYFKPVA